MTTVSTSQAILEDAPDPLPVFSSTRYAPATSHVDMACDKLRRAGARLGFSSGDQQRMCDLLRDLCSPWGDQPVGQPRYWSNASIEGSNLELSFSWDGRGSEIRIGFESLGEPPTRRSNLDACRALTRRLASYPGVSVARVLEVEEFFVSPRPNGLFPMGHALAFRPGQPPLFKIYMNPQFDGPETAHENMGQAMRRLGVGPAWESILRHLSSLGAPTPYTAGVALDLVDSPTSRIKVYLRHMGTDAARIDREAEVARGHVAGKFEKALREVTGNPAGGWAKPAVTLLTLLPGEERPTTATIYVPLIPVLENDALARDRVGRFMQDEGADPAPYHAALDAIADRPLSRARTHNFVAYQPRTGQPPRFAVYLAPGVYGE